MKLTRVLYKQHIGRQIQKLWYVKRQLKVGDTKAEEYLSTLGISVKDPLEVISPKKEELPRYSLLQNCIFASYILHISDINYKLYFV